MESKSKSTKPFLTDIQLAKVKPPQSLCLPGSTKESLMMSKTTFLPTIKQTRSKNDGDVSHFFYQKVLSKAFSGEASRTTRLEQVKQIEAQLTNTLLAMDVNKAERLVEQHLAKGGERAGNYLPMTRNKVINKMQEGEATQLVELRNRLNKIRFDVMKADKLCAALAKRLEGLTPAQTTCSGEASEERWKDTILQSLRVRFEIEGLARMRLEHRKDLNIVRKKHNLLKTCCFDMGKINARTLAVVEREEAYIAMLQFREGGLAVAGPRPNDEHLLDEIKSYIEALETKRIVEIEEKVVSTARLQAIQSSQRQVQEELHSCMREQRALTQSIDRCKKKNDELKNSLELITQKLHVSRDGELVQRVRDLFDQRNQSQVSHRGVQSHMTNSICFKARIIVETLRTNEASDVTLQHTPRLDSLPFASVRGNSCGKSPQRKTHSDELLKAIQTLTRVCFQLSPAAAASSSVTETTLLTTMTAVGLRLERLATACQAFGVDFRSYNPVSEVSVLPAAGESSCLPSETSGDLDDRKSLGEEK